MRSLHKAVKESKSFAELSKKLGYKYLNGKIQQQITNLLNEKNIDYFHLKKGGYAFKYKRIIKECPVCQTKFEALKGHAKEKVTCSYACSNTHFRSGEGNPNWKNSTYRTTCFLYHKKECIICGEKNIVTVHHFDENKKIIQKRI